jgi:type II secretory pathway pseudopilin PulG
VTRTAGWIRRRWSGRWTRREANPRGAGSRPVARVREAGFSLLEVMVASALVIIVFAGVSQYYVGGRRSLDYEEDRRAATEFLADRMERIRRTYTYDELPGLQGVDTTYVLGPRTYRVSHVIVPESPEVHATTVRLTVTWNAEVAGAPVARTMRSSTIFGRGMP